MRLEIFKNFELIDMIYSYESFEHTRKFADCGEFSLKLNNFNDINILSPNNIILVDNIAYIIENVHRYKNANKTIETEITGRSLKSILDRRVITNFTLNTNATYEQQIYKLIQDNYISPLDNNKKVDFIINANLKNINLKPNQEVIFENKYLLDLITEICKLCDLGFDMKYLPEENQIIFEVLEGKDLTNDVVFSEQFNNITDLEIYNQTKDYKNICYYKNNENIEVIGTGIGLDRREHIVSGDISEAIKQLEDRKEALSIECSVLSNEQFKYKIDWNLGDIVLIEDKGLNIFIEKRIIEIKETINESYYVELVFGDKILNIYEKLGRRLYGRS